MRVFLNLIATGAVALAAALSAQRLMPSHDPSPGARPALTEVARVNGVPLMSDRLDAAVNTLVPQESFHRSVSAKQMAALRKKALDAMIDQELEFQDGVRLGVGVTAGDVDAALAVAKQRYASPQAFDAALHRSGVTMADVRRELRRSLTIEKTRARQVTAKCTVNGADAARYFAANPDRFVVPEQLHVYAITIGVDPSGAPQQWADAKALARDVLRQINAGASFDKMARQYSTDASRATGGDMGFVHRGGLADEFEKAARDLAPGQVSDVIQTLYGYHIVRVADIRQPQRKTFGEVRAELQKDLAARRCVDTQAAWIARLRAGAPIVLAEAR